MSARTVRVVSRKWRDRPHWEFDALLLGTDAHGTWVGAPRGTLISRPGVCFRTQCDQVTLLPDGDPFVATFYAPGFAVSVYVDVSTPPTWAHDTVSGVDLDLDVVRGWTGRVWVDDEDEFAQHRVSLSYPDDLVRLASASCDDVHAAVRAGAAPYDGATGAGWLDRLREMMR
ncbi:MAG: DUF402 domain-containing protein [Nocardioidaceae bacterium]|nr:DUF402 domain-containing protein [Nocardioidaceae bacterium]NUS52447.1 DUF402 domain-containing protein [Nocardioidaceae bacterium]